MLSTLHPNTPGLGRARACLEAGRRDNTWNQYAGKFAAFVTFCTVVIPAGGAPAACPLPATVATVIAYLGWLQEQDSVHFGSLQPYMSAINTAHDDAGFARPAIGKVVGMTRKGFGELEAEIRGAPERRKGLPAPAAHKIMDEGLDTGDDLIMRECAAVSSTYQFFARGDTGAKAEIDRLVVDEEGLHFNEDAKNLPKIAPETLSTPWPPNRERSPHQLVVRFLAARKAAWLKAGKAEPVSLWQMPSDAGPPVPSDIGVWMLRRLDALGIKAPPGIKYTGHSLRGGAASAALAIGVSLPAICRWGLWRALDSVMQYLDPLVQPTWQAHVFFAHLLRRPIFHGE